MPVSSWVDCVAHDGRYTISARLSDLPAPRPAMVFAASKRDWAGMSERMRGVSPAPAAINWLLMRGERTIGAFFSKSDPPMKQAP